MALFCTPESLMSDIFSDLQLSSKSYVPLKCGAKCSSIVEFKWDITENDKEFTILADLPGTDTSKLKIDIDGSRMTISSERACERSEKDGEYYRQERRYGVYSRTIGFGKQVDRDGTIASYKNGVLKVVVPKVKPVERKSIEIKLE